MVPKGKNQYMSMRQAYHFNTRTTKFDTMMGAVLAVMVAGIIGVAHADSDINIGSLYPGEYPWYAPEVRTAQEFAVYEFNRYLDSKDAPWRLNVIYNHAGGNSSEALEAVKHYDSLGISVLTAATSTDIAGIKNFNKTDMLAVSCCSESALHAEQDMIYRLSTNVASVAHVLATSIQSEGIQNVLILHIRDDSWTSTYAEVLTEVFPHARTIPYTVQNGTVVDMDGMLAAARYMLGQMDPQTAIVLLGLSESTHIMAEANCIDELTDVPWYAADGLGDDPATLANPDAVAFAAKTGFRILAAEIPNTPVGETLAAHLTDNGMSYNRYAYAAYDSVWILGLAIEEAGSADALMVNAALPTVLASPDTYALSSTGILLDPITGDKDPSDVSYKFRGIVSGQWADID